MSVGAIAACRKKMIQEDKLLRECVRVRGNVPSIHREVRVTGTLAHVTEHLIVRPVLANHIHHVRDAARFARAFWHGLRRNAAPWCDIDRRIARQRQAIVLCH